MADSTSTGFSGFTLFLTAVVAGAAGMAVGSAAGLFAASPEARKKTKPLEERAPQALSGAPRGAKPTKPGLEIRVMQDDDDDEGWNLTVTKFDGVDQGEMYNGQFIKDETFASEAEAVKAAREMGKKAKASDKYALVRVIASEAEKKASAARRRRAKG